LLKDNVKERTSCRGKGKRTDGILRFKPTAVPRRAKSQEESLGEGGETAREKEKRATGLGRLISRT